jgi:N-acetylglucosaminyl-diphospho-decaprenol L-rhamnosyltransferase
MAFDICTVVVTNNHEMYIAKCIESVLLQKTHLNTKFFVVDNKSTDGTLDIIRKYGNKLKLVHRDQKYSLSNNNNIVLKNYNSKYFIVLNPDTVLPQGVLSKLYHFMEEFRHVGACGPRLEFPDGKLQYSCRKFPTPTSFLLRRTPLRLFLNEEARGRSHLMVGKHNDSACEVDWMLGACIIFRERALKDVGYFDERYRLYCEDIDICFCIWKSGWSVYYNPNITVVHDHLAKTDRTFLSRYSFWHYQSIAKYIFKHGIAGLRRPLHCKRKRVSEL